MTDAHRPLDVACNYCGANPGARCQTVSALGFLTGKTGPHLARRADSAYKAATDEALAPTASALLRDAYTAAASHPHIPRAHIAVFLMGVTWVIDRTRKTLR